MQVRLGVGGCGIVMHRLGILFIHAYADMEQTPYFLHNNTSEVSVTEYICDRASSGREYGVCTKPSSTLRIFSQPPHHTTAHCTIT